MSAIKFELEQVLRYRRDMEKMKKQEFAFAKQELESASDQLELEKNQVTRLTQEFNDKQSEFKTIDELNNYVQFFAKKRDDITRQKEQVEYLDGVLNDRREDLLHATKDKKVLESLKDKKISQLKVSAEQKERNFLDEISIQKNGGNG